MADGSQWAVNASSMGQLARSAQDIIGRDLRNEKYYVRYVEVDGKYDQHALNEFMVRLRG